MPDLRHEIAKKIENGEYFQDAREWYKHKYIFPVIERSYLILITIISVITAILTFSTFNGLFPLQKSFLIVAPVQDQVNDYAKILRIGESGQEKEDADETLINFISGKFVGAFENYNYENNFQQLRSNINFLTEFASPEVLNQYKYYISIRNPNSLMLKYKQQASRKIEVKSLRLLGGTKKEIDKKFAEEGQEPKDERQYTAIVDFISTEKTAQGENQSNWQARIDFLYSNVKYNREEKEFSPINYKVVGYQSVEISKK